MSYGSVAVFSVFSKFVNVRKRWSMPTRKLKLTLREQVTHDIQLSRLEELGILQSTRGYRDVSKRLLVTPWDGEVAQICELPSGQLVLILPIEMMANRSNVLIVDHEITLFSEPLELDLDGPQDDYARFKKFFYEWPPTILNHWFGGERLLPKKKLRGVILGYAWMPIRPEYPDGMRVKITLTLADEMGAECRLGFQAFLDRTTKRRHEEMRRELAVQLRPEMRTDVFGPARRARSDASRIGVTPNDGDSSLEVNIAERSYDGHGAENDDSRRC